LQWEHISDAVTESIVDVADGANSDDRRRSSIAPLDPLGGEAPHLQEWLEQAAGEQ
jgi:hypothetical protein